MSSLSVELEYTFSFPGRNGRSLWAVIIIRTWDSCRKGKFPMSTADDYRRVAWHYLKLAEGTSNPKTGASLLNLADYWAKRGDECAARAQSIRDRNSRPAFDALCKAAARREFNVVMAWSVDRLGRSLQDLVAFLSEIHALKIDLYLHQQGLDTTTPAGKALFQMMGVFAEFERAMIAERVRAGMLRARVILKIAKIRMKLRGKPHPFNLIPKRPPGMPEKVYTRLKAQLELLEYDLRSCRRRRYWQSRKPRYELMAR